MSLYLGDIPIANDGSHRITGEIGDIGLAPLGIDESLNLRRYLNGQVISQLQFVAFTVKVKAAVALFPNLSTTEANWQAEKLLSKFGQVGKFVIDDENQTIRLPAVVNPQGLLSLLGIGNLVSESLPNITGEFTVINNGGAGQVRNPSGAFRTSYTSATLDYTNAPNSNTTYSTQQTTFDASRSSSTYQDNAPVQQEAVQYPYYIQVATGVEETLPAIREYKVNNSDFFGKSMYSDVAPDNASWLVSNGSYNAKTVYPDYYDWLVSHIGETITSNGGKVVLSTGTYTDYDFVVNQNDQTFRLPLLNGEEDLRGSVTESVSGAVSGTVTTSFTATKNGWLSGKSFSSTEQSFVVFATDGYEICRTHASLGAAATIEAFIKAGQTISVQFNNLFFLNFTPAVGNGTLYYYIGDTVQDASLINAGAVLGQLSNKADIDLSNLSNGLANTICTTTATTTSSASSARPAVVVENYRNGTSWYRIWSDGWIEQGNSYELIPVAGKTVTLLKSYSSANFSAYVCRCTKNFTTSQNNPVCGRPSKSSIAIGVGGGADDYAQWYACGY